MPIEARNGRIAFLFSAGAEPLPGNGRELRDTFPVFADTLDDICGRLDPYLELPLESVMFADDGTRTAALLEREPFAGPAVFAGTRTAALLEREPFAGPAVFALQVAQYRLLRSWGVLPDVVFGQAAGRMAAAYAAGVFSLADACHAVGTLARLLGGPADPEPYSAHLDGVLDAYGRTLATLHPCAPRLPLVSDVTARPVGAETAEPGFWVRRAPLRFAEAAGRLHRDGVRTWLELGPGDRLTRLLPECLPECVPGGTASAFALSRDWAVLRSGPTAGP